MSLIRKLMRDAALAGSCAASFLVPSAHAGTHTVLYSFGTGGDAGNPAASMTGGGSTLYGTAGGGAHSAGAVFQVSNTGSEKLVYSFANGPNDGATPVAPVVNVGGALYGTTQYGGSTACNSGCGTVYGVTTTGAESMLYKFQGGNDGANPTAGLLNDKGTMYGTTFYGGGANNYGTVFSITADCTEKVLYAFKGGSDGANPMGGLIKIGKTLYGTTYTGGGYYGTVFSLTTAGVKKTLYTFKDGADGAYPEASLVAIGKTLYGMTQSGSPNYDGTVFSLSTKGKYKTLYSFKGGADGSGPEGSLINAGGTLYGVTYSGGSTTACSGYGCGTVFSVAPKTGAETVVYAFQGGNDGLHPEGGLNTIKNAMYGTTNSGGANYNGTVFTAVP
ncbi:MAG TPA: choice-of-anchor tandem repeat GloVer-containing protein [Rhizomicrobium sp.]|jgi:uncharacterized repeat protein (TIGR03803 family)|nr:choice-of-anchor tandem repeat GloVer-containing protein [Rhizomicrobium sp.]